MNRLIEFQTREDLMLIENQLTKNNIACDLVATPAVIKRGCGLSLKFNEEDMMQVMTVIAELNIDPSFELYENGRSASGRPVVRKIASSILR